MSFQTRNRIRWTLALLMCVLSILMCGTFEFSAQTTWLIAMLFCPVERPLGLLIASWRRKFGALARDIQSTVQLLQKRA